MNLTDAIQYIGAIDNASGQICQIKDDKPVLILFEFACPNCSEIASIHADEYGDALVAIVNAAPELLTALREDHRTFNAILELVAKIQRGEHSKHLLELIADYANGAVASLTDVLARLDA